MGTTYAVYTYDGDETNILTNRVASYDALDDAPLGSDIRDKVALLRAAATEFVPTDLPNPTELAHIKGVGYINAWEWNVGGVEIDIIVLTKKENDCG